MIELDPIHFFSKFLNTMSNINMISDQFTLTLKTEICPLTPESDVHPAKKKGLDVLFDAFSHRLQVYLKQFGLKIYAIFHTYRHHCPPTNEITFPEKTGHSRKPSRAVAVGASSSASNYIVRFEAGASKWKADGSRQILDEIEAL